MKTKIEYESGISETNKLICEKYWLRKSEKRNEFRYTCKQIGEDFDLRAQDISGIAKINAYLVILDCQCIDCDTTQICHTRTQLTQLTVNNWRCDMCWDALKKRRNQALLEQQLKQKRVEEKQRQAALEYLHTYRSAQLTEIPSITALNEVDRLLIAATIESLGAENLKTTISLRDNLLLPLSPFFTLDEHILHHLFRLNVLLLAPEESYENININKQQELEVDYNQVIFEFAYNIDDLTKIRVGARTIKNINYLVANTQYETWCQQIQLYECLSYLVTRAKLNSLAPPIGEKLIGLLRKCLTECSLSVMYYIIWKAVESAAAFAQKPDITRKHASNAISGNIERVFGKISSGSWHYPNKSYRDASHPQSAMAKIFFDYVFGLDDCGFHNTLNELFNPYKMQQAIEKTSYSTLGNVQITNCSVAIGDLKIV